MKILAAVLCLILQQFDLVDLIGIKPDDLFHALSKIIFFSSLQDQAALQSALLSQCLPPGALFLSQTAQLRLHSSLLCGNFFKIVRAAVSPVQHRV